jgi:hypothetical protein
MAIMSISSSMEMGDKPRGLCKLLSYACALPVVASGALIPVMLSLVLFLNSTPALAQDSHPGKNLTDMSLEELMAVRIDSVYGASEK